MDGIDKELDKIFLIIQRLPEGEVKDRVTERYNKYRQIFENNPQKATGIDPIGMEIIWFSANLELYAKGIINADFLVESEQSKTIENNLSSNSEEISRTKEIEQILIEMLNKEIQINDIDSLKEQIDRVEKEYKKLKTKNQELDLKISEARYMLMKGLLKSGRIEEAKQLTEKFNTDMSIFLYTKLSGQINGLRERGKLEEALFLTKYCKGMEQREKELEFWERLINIDEP